MHKTRKTATLIAALAVLALASGSALAGHDHWKGHKNHKQDRHHSCANVVSYPRSSRVYYAPPQVRYYYDDYAPTRYYDGGGHSDIVFQYRYRY